MRLLTSVPAATYCVLVRLILRRIEVHMPAPKTSKLVSLLERPVNRNADFKVVFPQTYHDACHHNAS
jgi:hypothetical protein